MDQGDETGLCSIRDTTSYDRGEDDTHRWAEVTLEQPSGAGRGEQSPAYSPPAGHFETDFLAEWEVEQDVSRWETVYSRSIPFSSLIPVKGVLWTPIGWTPVPGLPEACFIDRAEHPAWRGFGSEPRPVDT